MLMFFHKKKKKKRMMLLPFYWFTLSLTEGYFGASESVEISKVISSVLQSLSLPISLLYLSIWWEIEKRDERDRQRRGGDCRVSKSFFEISADVNSILAEGNAYEIHSSWADEKRTRKFKFIFRRLVKIYYNYPNNFVQIKIDKYA